MHEWQPHNGESLPVPPDALVFIRQRDGMETEEPIMARDLEILFMWGDFSPAWDIVEYRICTVN